MKKTALALAALVAGVSAHAADSAEASSLAGTVDITFVNNYFFRGAEFSDATIHPSIELTYGAGYAGIWGAAEFGDEGSGTSNNYKEYDLYAGYNFSIADGWTLDFGATQYVYPDNNAGTSFETYLGLQGSLGGLSQALYFYHDFDIDTYTLQYSTGYSIALESLKSSLDFSGTVGYVQVDGADDDIAGASDTYVYYSLGVSMPFQISENAKLSVGVAYVNATEETASFNEAAGAITNDGKVVGSIGLSVGF
jgi:uncharacterized protein (TIGR02001 family)